MALDRQIEPSGTRDDIAKAQLEAESRFAAVVFTTLVIVAVISLCWRYRIPASIAVPAFLVVSGALFGAYTWILVVCNAKVRINVWSFAAILAASSGALLLAL